MHVDECWHCGLTRSPRSGGAERRRTLPRAHKRSGFRTGRTRATSQLSRPPQCGIAVALGTAKSPGCGSSAVSVRFAWRVILVVHPGVSRRAPDGPADHHDGTLPWSRPRRWGIAVVAGSGCGSGRGPAVRMRPLRPGLPGRVPAAGPHSQGATPMSDLGSRVILRGQSYSASGHSRISTACRTWWRRVRTARSMSVTRTIREAAPLTARSVGVALKTGPAPTAQVSTTHTARLCAISA